MCHALCQEKMIFDRKNDKSILQIDFLHSRSFIKNRDRFRKRRLKQAIESADEWIIKLYNFMAGIAYSLCMIVNNNT